MNHKLLLVRKLANDLFLEQLINDFKKEINNINNELVITYNNFYRKIEKEFSILLSDDSIRLKVNKINFDINYSVKFKEFYQVY
ncbi:hypothetical protein [Spiroplasma endosymbiont of Ammophila pubescens]|uniref:hypothetical protein n=1 Tax=Spiroplasma endosymbiont of Ammophila pubescens TaxID=3066315 RepID=UPI0032B24EAE